MNKHYKKAQGALEFLMTYGWAFLVILIMIGALAYFGVLNPSKFLPDKCTFGTEVLCKKAEFVITNNPDEKAVYAKVTNQFGSNVKIYGATSESDIDALKGCIVMLDNNEIPPTADDPAYPEMVWKDGESKTISLNCAKAANLGVGDKVKVLIKFKWYQSSSSKEFSHTINGEIFSEVQKYS